MQTKGPWIRSLPVGKREGIVDTPAHFRRLPLSKIEEIIVATHYYENLKYPKHTNQPT
jgi:hypothetical protein